MTHGLSGGPVLGVVLDYGGTLVTFETPADALVRAYTRIARLLAVERAGPVLAAVDLMAAVHDRVEAAVAAHEAAGGLREVELQPVYADAYLSVGYDLDPALLERVQAIEQHAWFDGVRPGEGALDALAALRAGGLRLVLCSNAPYHAPSLRAQIDHIALTPLLDAIVLSSELGWRKPAVPMGEAALTALGLPPERAVVVGDRVREDVGLARAVGMRSILVRQHRREIDQDGLADAAVETLAELPGLLLPQSA